jgi:hypothetical protein
MRLHMLPSVICRLRCRAVPDLRKALCLALVVPALLSSQPSVAADKDFVYLTVRKTGLHEGADFFSPVKGNLQYGDPLVVLSRKEHWFQVKSAKGLTGFIHESALTSDKDDVRLAGASAATSVTSGEVSLAGKGFSAEVEEQLEKRNSALNFSAVDQLERVNVQPTTVQSFAKKGKLTRRPTA